MLRSHRLILAALLAFGAVALALGVGAVGGGDSPAAADDTSSQGERAVATFAGGCFWCMEGPFDKLDGVPSTTSGYIGGTLDKPTYEQVSAGNTGHAEAVQVVYDPKRVSYAELLTVFWRNIDPTTPDRQFCDRGSQYRPGIFYHDEAQRAAAEASRSDIERSKSFKAPIKTEIVAATEFFAAEDYHQDYYLKNPLRYKFYRYNCGRDQRLQELWGPSS